MVVHTELIYYSLISRKYDTLFIHMNHEFILLICNVHRNFKSPSVLNKKKGLIDNRLMMNLIFPFIVPARQNTNRLSECSKTRCKLNYSFSQFQHDKLFRKRPLISDDQCYFVYYFVINSMIMLQNKQKLILIERKSKSVLSVSCHF